MVTQEKDVFDAQDGTGIALFLHTCLDDVPASFLTHIGCLVWTSTTIIRTEHIIDLPTLFDPTGHGSCTPELGIISVGHNHHCNFWLFLFTHLNISPPWKNEGNARSIHNL